MRVALVSIIAVVVICGGSLTAQIPVTPTRDQAALLLSTDSQLAKNKSLVYDFWRIVLESGHVEEVDKYVADSYVQHNPNIATGKQGLVAYIKRWVKPVPVRQTARSPIISIVAEGDMVVVSEVLTVSMPNVPNGHYTTTSFDMFRIMGDKIVEHWDSETLEKAAT